MPTPIVTRDDIRAIVDDAIERATDAIASSLPDTPREGQRYVALVAITTYIRLVREREQALGPLPRIAT